MTGQELIDALERLIDEPILDHDAWLGQTGLLRQAVSVKPPISDAFFHFLSHYLNDDGRLIVGRERGWASR